MSDISDWRSILGADPQKDTAPVPSTAPTPGPLGSYLDEVDVGDWRKTLIDTPTPATKKKPPKEEDESWFGSLWETITGAKAREKLRVKMGTPEGQDIEEVDFLEVLKSAGARDPADQAINWLRDYGDKYQIKIDKDTKSIWARDIDKPDEAVKVRNLPGISWNDIAELGGELQTTLGAWIGLKTVERIIPKKLKLAGRIARSAIGLGGGAAVGELARIESGKRSGQYGHLSEKELSRKRFLDPVQAVGEELGGAALMRGGAALYKVSKAAIRGKWMPTDFVERGLELPENMPEVVGQVNAALEAWAKEQADNLHGVSPVGKAAKRAKEEYLESIFKKFNPDSARLLNDPEFMAAVIDVGTRQGAEGNALVRELYRNNIEALTTYQDKIQNLAMEKVGDYTPTPGRTPQYDAGVETKKALEAPVERQSAELEAQTAAAAQDVGQATSELTLGRGPAGSSIGPESRAIFSGTQEAEQQAFHKRFTEIGKEIDVAGTKDRGPRFYARSTQNIARDYVARTKGTPTEGTSFSGNELSDMERMFQNVTMFSKQGEEVGTKTFSYVQMADHLKLIRRNLRAAYAAKGTGGKADIELMHQLEEAAEKDLVGRLKSMPDELAERYVQLTGDYQKFKTKWAKDAFQNFVGYKPNGDPKIVDESLFKNMFGVNDSKQANNAFHVAEFIEEGGHLDVRNAIRGAIFEEFNSVTTKGVGGKFNETVARTWLKERSKSLNYFLSPKELTQLRRVKSTNALFNQLEKENAAWQKSLKKLSPEQDLRTAKASKIFGKIFENTESVEEATEVLAKRHPREWAIIKNAGLQQIKELFSKTDKLIPGDEVLSYEAMQEALTPDFRKKIKLMYGNEYVTNLQKLMEAAEILGRKPGTATRTGLDNSLITAMRQAAFGPLDHRSYIIRILGRWGARKQLQDFSTLVLDPVRLNKAARALHTTKGMKRFQMLTGGLLAGQYLTKTPEDVTRSDLLNRLQGPKGVNVKNWDDKLLKKVKEIIEE